MIEETNATLLDADHVFERDSLICMIDLTKKRGGALFERSNTR
jgi:hypothetical protein